MSLQFIMGPSGSGKSHYLYEWVTKESIKHPKRRYIVLVPEQFTMQTQKDLVAANPNGGILNVDVLSFNRLAHRVFEEVGEAQKIILDDEGKNLIIRKVLGECKDELKVLKDKWKKTGYVTEVKSILSELTQYDIRPYALEDMRGRMKDNPVLSYKLGDIAIIYEKFMAYLRGKYITGEEVPDVLAEVACASGILKGSVIALDGFTGFTPVQNKLLRVLLGICRDVAVTVTMDPSEDPYTLRTPYQLLALSKKMVSSLTGIAAECGVNMADPVCLYQRPAYRFKGNAPLGFMESHLFRYTRDVYDEPQEAVRVICAKNPAAEADYVARSIRRLVRTKNYRYRDFAVIMSDMEAYAGHIERSFEAYDLPVFMDYKRTILLNSCVEYVRSLLAMAEQNFTYESVFRYLRTGLAGLSSDETDRLENYVLALGIKGYKKWNEKWIRKAGYMEEEDLILINQIREKFMSGIEEIMGELKSREKTVFSITNALHTFFVKEELQKKVTEYQSAFAKAGEFALEKEYAQIYRILIELLDKFAELLGEEKISLKEYCDLLDAGLEEAKVGIIPPSIDRVVAGDVERSRIKDVKAVFLIGANDAYIPGNESGSGLLTGYDREFLEEHGMTLAPSAREKAYIQKFYLYLLLTKASDRVYLTYSETSSEGKAMRPSYLISDIRRLFPTLKVREVKDDIKDREFTKENGIECLAEGLRDRNTGLGMDWQELFSWYMRDPCQRKKAEDLVDAAFYAKPDSTLKRETARSLYGEILENSVTRLEDFSKCAYSHFLAYGLGLKEREEYRFRAIDLGILFHASIEKFSRKLEQRGFTWNNLTDSAGGEIIEESVEECITDYGNSVLYSTARNEYVISRLKRMLSRTVWALKKQLEKGDFGPAGYEIAFGKLNGLKSSDMDLPGLGRVSLRGKIDRVDMCEEEDKVYVKVVDYKTGAKVFDLGELCYGLQMQLIIYMNAALEMQQKKYPGKKIIPAGIFYYRMMDPIVDKPVNIKGTLRVKEKYAEEPGEGQEEGLGEETGGESAEESMKKSVEDRILRELRPDGVVQDTEDVIRHLDRDFTSQSSVIPVSRTNSGALKRTSSVLSEEEFNVLSEFARVKIKETGAAILEGEAGIAPYRLDKETGCEYCPYHTVCKFDEHMPGFSYRELEKKDKEGALTVMRENLEKSADRE